MSTDQARYRFNEIHIDAARNSTDDFNPFHDKKKWHHVENNPFSGIIALGFQLACCIENQIRIHRSSENEHPIIAQKRLCYSNYQLNFANAIKVDDPFTVQVKKTKYRTHPYQALRNRVIIKNDTGLAVIGYKCDAAAPLLSTQTDWRALGDLSQYPDRSYVKKTDFFLKRKFMSTGSAKNFLTGSLVEQSDYFDELAEKVCFPEIFPTALISCALLEKALQEGHNFEKNPMVYTTHHYSVHKPTLGALKSNDVLHILIGPQQIIPGETGLGHSAMSQYCYQCYGLTQSNQLLFQAEIFLVELQQILASKHFLKA